MRRPLFTICIIFVIGIVGDAQAPVIRSPASIADTFLARVGKGEVGPAYDELFRNSPMTHQSLQIDTLKRQTQSVLPVYGKVLGFELYKQEKFGESLVRLIYVQRFEKHPIIWKFWIYKPAGTWRVNMVTFNDQLVFE